MALITLLCEEIIYASLEDIDLGVLTIRVCFIDLCVVGGH